MIISTREAFLGKNQMKDWAVRDPGIVYINDPEKLFNPLIKEYPEDFKHNIRGNEVMYTNGEDVKWAWITIEHGEIIVANRLPLADLQSESPYIYYVPEYKLIMFAGSYDLNTINDHLHEIRQAITDYQPVAGNEYKVKIK
jgi:hypothetical protein